MQLIQRKGWLNGETKVGHLLPGETLASFADRTFPDEMRRQVQVQLNSEPMPDWSGYTPKEGDHILIYYLPLGGGDGKNPLVAIAAIALSVFAPQAAATIWGAGTTAASIGTTVFMIGGGMILNQIAQSMIKPPTQADSFNYDEDPFYGFSNVRNLIDPFGSVARIYGKIRHYPKMVAQPYTEIKESKQYLHQVFDFGYGPLNLSNLKIGESSINLFDEIDVREYRNFTKDTTLEYFGNRIETSDGGGAVNESFIARTTKLNTRKAVLDLYFTQGLYNVDKNTGSRSNQYVRWEVEARPIGGTWQPARHLGYVIQSNPYIASEWVEVSGLPFFPAAENGEFYASIGSELGLIAGRSEWNNGAQNPEDRIYYDGWRAGQTTVFINTTYYKPGLSVGSRVYFDRKDEPLSGLLPNQMSGTLVKIHSGQKLGYVLEVELDQPITDTDIITHEYYYVNDSVYQRETTVLLEGNYYYFIRGTKYITGLNANVALNSGGLINQVIHRAEPFGHSITVDFFLPGQYEIRIRKASGDTGNYAFNDTNWTQLISHIDQNGAMFKPLVDHTVVEMRILATDQLSGQVDDFNAIATSVLKIPQFDGAGNVTGFNEEPTRNPAWCFLDVLRGSATKNKTIDSNIDFAGLLDWANECSEPSPNDPDNARFNCDLVVSGETTVKETLSNIASCGRASPSRQDNKMGVVRRKPDAAPVQLITPKNTLSFSSVVTYITPPDALKVSFNDAAEGYVPSEEVVFNDGFDQSNAAVYEELKLNGTTSRKQAWRLGRYFLASGILERERVICTMDIESLVAQRGDRVKVAHDVLKAGGKPLRITNVNGNTLTFDEPMQSATDALRKRDGEAADIITCTPVADDMVEFDGIHTFIEGDIVEYGISETIYAPFTVERISPGPDYTAELRLIEFRAGVDDAVLGEIPVRRARIGSTGSAPIGAVQNLNLLVNEYSESGKSYVEFTLDWKTPKSGHVDYYNILISANNSPPRFYAKTIGNQYKLNRMNRSDLTESVMYAIAVEPVIEMVGKGPLAAAFSMLTPDVTQPPDVEDLSCNALSEQLMLFWSMENITDVDHYEIRYNQSEGATWEQSTIVTKSVAPTATDTTVPLRTGQYMIKAVDAARNYSESAASTIVQVNDIEAVEIFDDIDFEPFTDGTYENTEEDSGVLLLDGTEDVGWYYPNENLTFAAPTKVRLVSSITTVAIALDDSLDALWFDPLINANPLSPSALVDNTLVDGQIYFRYTNGGTITDSPWTRLMVADVTATEIQFSIRLQTFDDRLTPSVSATNVRADYNERRETGEVTVSSASPENVSFANGFARPPMVAITLENSSPGDSFIVSGISETGFTVTIYDNTQTIITGQFNWSAFGFGKLF